MYVAILGLALGGLAVDRLLLNGGPAPRKAAAHAVRDASDEPSTTAASASALAPFNAAANRQVTLASRLDEMAKARRLDPAQVADAFAPSQSWVSIAAVKPVETNAPPVDEIFRKSHRLMAVVLNGASGAAIINDKTYVVGMEVGGFTLRSLTKRSAVFERDGQRVELELAQPLDKSSR